MVKVRCRCADALDRDRPGERVLRRTDGCETFCPLEVTRKIAPSLFVSAPCVDLKSAADAVSVMFPESAEGVIVIGPTFGARNGPSFAW
jgi:hypothetical protein